MERYIGELKGMVSQMSSIDANLAHKAIIAEHLNHLPRPAPDSEDEDASEPPQPTHEGRTPRDDFPKPPDKRFRSRAELTPRQLTLLHNFHGDNSFRRDQITKWKKYWLRSGYAVGSSADTNRAVNRRDDSWVSYYRVKKRHGRPAQRKLHYGQVLLYAECCDWDAVALIQPFSRVDLTIGSVRWLLLVLRP